MADYGPPARYCGTKQRLTWSAAQTEARRLERKDRLPMKVYRCDACGWRHVAHERPLKKTTWRERLGLKDV